MNQTQTSLLLAILIFNTITNTPVAAATIPDTTVSIAEPRKTYGNIYFNDYGEDLKAIVRTTDSFNTDATEATFLSYITWEFGAKNHKKGKSTEKVIGFVTADRTVGMKEYPGNFNGEFKVSGTGDTPPKWSVTGKFKTEFNLIIKFDDQFTNRNTHKVGWGESGKVFVTPTQFNITDITCSNPELISFTNIYKNQAVFNANLESGMATITVSCIIDGSNIKKEISLEIVPPEIVITNIFRENKDINNINEVGKYYSSFSTNLRTLPQDVSFINLKISIPALQASSSKTGCFSDIDEGIPANSFVAGIMKSNAKEGGTVCFFNSNKEQFGYFIYGIPSGNYNFTNGVINWNTIIWQCSLAKQTNSPIKTFKTSKANCTITKTNPTTTVNVSMDTGHAYAEYTEK